MPAKSKSQQHLMGWVYACKTGKEKNCPANIQKIAKSITTKAAKEFTKTKTKKLGEVKHHFSLLDFLQETEDNHSMWVLNGHTPNGSSRPSQPISDPDQDEKLRRKRINSEIKPKPGDLIQSLQSNYIVLSYTHDGIKLKEIKTGKIGTMPSRFRFERTTSAPNGRRVFKVIS